MTTKEGFRDFSLSDARKVHALASVTNVLGLLSKPGLVRWQVEQGIEAALDAVGDRFLEDSSLIGTTKAPRFAGPLVASDPETIQLIYQKSQEYTRYTQDFGTATHWWLNKKLRAAETTEIPPMVPGAEEVADGILDWLAPNGYSFALTEHRFARPDLGYAGTVDLVGEHYGVPCIVDIKTQEPPLTPYSPEYPLQLAGYDLGMGNVMDWAGDGPRAVMQSALDKGWQPNWERERISLIANRINPGEVHQHLWVDKGSTVAQTNQRYDRMWLTLLEFWFMVNQYDPRTNDAG